MLFIRSNGLPVFLDERERLRLLDALAARELAPLIRSARRRFELLTAGTMARRSPDPPRVGAGVRRAARAEGGSYTPANSSASGDCVLFLAVRRGRGEGVCAENVYSVATPSRSRNSNASAAACASR